MASDCQVGVVDAERFAPIREEALDHLEAVAAGLVCFLEQAGGQDALYEMRERICALKETAIHVEWEAVAFLAYHTESLLTALHRGQIDADAETLQLLHKSIEGIAIVVIDPCETDLVDDLLGRFPDSLGDSDSCEKTTAKSVHPDEIAEVVSRELFEVFREESNEILDVIEGSLSKLQREPHDAEALQEIRRATHILRGAAGAVQMHPVVQLTQYMEDLLEQMFANGLAATPEVLELLTESRNGLCQSIGKTTEESQQSLEPLLSLYASLLQDHQPDPPPTSASADVSRDSTWGNEDVDEPICAELFAVFCEEVEDIFRVIYGSLGQLEEDPNDRDALQEIRRAAHTLKGAAGAVGLRPVTQLAHRMEDVLDGVYEGGVTVTQDTVQVLYRGTDCLQELAMQSGDTVANAEVIDDLLSDFASLVQGKIQTEGTSASNNAAAQVAVCESPEKVEGTIGLPASVPSRATSESNTRALEPPAAQVQPGGFDTALPQEPPKSKETEERPRRASSPDISWSPSSLSVSPAASGQAARVNKPSAQESGPVLRVPIEDLDQLVSVVSELVVNRSQFELCMSYLGNFVDELNLSAQRLRQLSTELSNRLGTQVQMQANPAACHSDRQTLCGQVDEGAFSSEFDPLELDRYTEFHPLTQSLTEASDDLGTLGERIHGLKSELNSLLNQQGRLSYAMQDRLMDTRMVSLKTLMSRLQRAVRSVASETGKQVLLTVDGQDIEVDKKILDGMADPLLHLVRNAVDHGIERREDRVANGKPEQARVHVRAFHRGTKIVIQVSDDGQGLRTDAIRRMAVERGVVSAENAASMSSDQVHALIFHVGFSTAKEVNEFSGRGVGMDVVRQNVQQLKGSIDVASNPGQGSTFSISLPTSLSMAKAIMVTAGDELFAIPMSAVRHICRMPNDSRTDGQRIVGVDGQSYPLIHLSDQLNLERKTNDAEDSTPILMVESGDGHVALRVDRVLPSRDMIVKSLGSHLRRVPGLMGATLMGDGTVVPILELGELLDESYSVDKHSVQQPVLRRPDPLTVLLVDDSVSVRKVMSRLISNAGWNPIPAKDGVDALETLDGLADTPEVFLLDVEMPRMDGFELLSKLRADERYQNVPVVMVSSRAGEKHRRKAKELGATDYVVKPFQEQALLGLICKLTGKARETVLA